eukprot:365296-Chlamydomonas_euryale.AAC.10
MRVLSAGMSAVGLERSWSNFGSVHNDKRNKLVQRRTDALVPMFAGMKLMRTRAKKASQGRHKDPIPWRWREDEEDQQVKEEEGEDLPVQEKQPVLEEETAAAAKAAAAAAVIDIDTNLEDF